MALAPAPHSRGRTHATVPFGLQLLAYDAANAHQSAHWRACNSAAAVPALVAMAERTERGVRLLEDQARRTQDGGVRTVHGSVTAVKKADKASIKMNTILQVPRQRRLWAQCAVFLPRVVCALGVFCRLQAGGEDESIERIMEEAVKRQFDVAKRKDPGETLRWFAALQLLQRLNTESGVPGWTLHFTVRSQNPTVLKDLTFRNTNRRVLDQFEASKRDSFRNNGFGIQRARQWLERSSSGAR